MQPLLDQRSVTTARIARQVACYHQEGSAPACKFHFGIIASHNGAGEPLSHQAQAVLFPFFTLCDVFLSLP